MAMNWLQKWWWKIKPPAPSVPYEEWIVKPYLALQDKVSQAHVTFFTQPVMPPNSKPFANEFKPTYTHLSQQVIAYDQRSWWGKSWVWLRGKRNDIDQKRLWCAAYLCQPLQAPSLSLTQSATAPPRLLTVDNIHLIKKLLNPVNQPALPTSWRDNMKNIVQGWKALYKPAISKPVNVKKPLTIHDPKRKLPVFRLSPDKPATPPMLDQQSLKDALVYANACGFLQLDPFTLKENQLEILKEAFDRVCKNAKMLAEKNKVSAEAYDAFFQQAHGYYKTAQQFYSKIAALPSAQWQAYKGKQRFLAHYLDGMTLRNRMTHTILALPKDNVSHAKGGVEDKVKKDPSQKNDTPPPSMALILSPVPALALKKPIHYKEVLIRFISACGFYRLDILKTTPRQVASYLRKSIAILHTDKTPQEGISSEGKVITYSAKAKEKYNQGSTERLTALKKLFDITDLPANEVPVRSGFFSEEDIVIIYQKGQEFRIQFDDMLEDHKKIASFQSELDSFDQAGKELDLEIAAVKSEIEQDKAELEAKNAVTKAELEAKNAMMQADFKATLEEKDQVYEARFQELARMIAGSELAAKPAMPSEPVAKAVTYNTSSPRLFKPTSVEIVRQTTAPSTFSTVINTDDAKVALALS